MSKKKDSFSNFIFLSLLFHIAILVALTVKVLFFPAENLEYQRSVRIDVVALPEKEEPKPEVLAEQPKAIVKKEEVKKEESKPVEKKEPPKPKKIVKKEAPKVDLQKKKQKEVKEEQNSAIARLKAMQKIKDKQKDEQSKEKEYKGNAISKGNALTGLEKLHHDNYLDTLDTHIRNHWNLPEWLASGNLKASVLLLINKSGGVVGKSFISKSGNDLFDEHVMGTIEKANPLPPPPSNLVDFYSTKGVEIRFPE